TDTREARREAATRGSRRAQDADAHAGAGGGVCRGRRHGQVPRSPLDRTASRTCSGCCSALAPFFQCRFPLPSGPIHTVDRMTPIVFLPYIIFSPYAP